MRLGSVIFVLMLPMLLGCKLLPSGEGQFRRGADIATTAETAIDGTEGRVSDTGIRPKPRPGSVPTTEPSVKPPEPIATPPEVRITKEQISCEKQGGTWGKAGRSQGQTCIKRTRDGGKQCRKESDCDGVCLARSGTCAPAKPLFGCNEILQNDGRRVTLCVD